MPKQHQSCCTFCNYHGRQDCLNPESGETIESGEILQSAEEETEADDIEINHPDDSDVGIEQDNKDEAGVIDDQVSDYMYAWE